MKINERVWAGQIISWIHEEIREKRTIFQDATNDVGIKLENGKTKFPDILLFIDKISGVIFNGWELKFPDTNFDDLELLNNALEKAKRIKSNSFVTWNGAEAAIWKINDLNYSFESLTRIKTYDKEPNINNRNDLADPNNYKNNEQSLKNRLIQILHDLEHLYQNDKLKHAINISDNFISAVKEASEIILPQFKAEILKLKGENVAFRKEFNKWKIYESSTLKILASSSRRKENVIEEEVLAKFTYYNLIGKIIFYLTLSENLTAVLKKIDINNINGIKITLESYFKEAQKIDYQAVFKPYFTDIIEFNNIVNKSIYYLLKTISEIDFRILPTEVIGTILENLVPKEEKQKFGQYFTSEILANIVAFPVVQTVKDYVFDPTSGTGTFLNSFYKIFNYYGNVNHSQLINQIWGNDISHFPAILSVINLYKQKVNQTDNFPRIIRDDYFNLETGKTVTFPSTTDYKVQIEQPIPIFDAIASNFPFIQQEDIPNDVLTDFFREKFELKQQAFLKDKSFKINERSDYFTYCIYNSIRFLKPNGYLSAITSNAWLGKEYGLQFKKFLLDNFHIKYIVKSNAEHWFQDSKVSTIYIVLQYIKNDDVTKFITLNNKIDDLFSTEPNDSLLNIIDDFYVDIDNCDNTRNNDWSQNKLFDNLYHNNKRNYEVSIISKNTLERSLKTQENWGTYFISPNLFKTFDEHLIKLYPTSIDVFRGERTGWNEMFILSEEEVIESKIESTFLIPYLKSPSELNKIKFDNNFNYYLFTCDLGINKLKKEYPGAYEWIMKFQNKKNKNGTKTIKEACSNHKPFWYSLKPKKASIVTAINPYERYFFSYSNKPFTIDQRFAGITISNQKNLFNEKIDLELLTALLNSIITLITIEMKGTSRNLGALDLNANYFKVFKFLNPFNLATAIKIRIIQAFKPLCKRNILTIFEELSSPDRIEFDNIILESYGIDKSIRKNLYDILLSNVEERISLKDK